MKKSQLNAISYAYARKERERQAAEMERLGIDMLFKYQTKSKTPRGFLRNYEKKAVLLEIAKKASEQKAKRQLLELVLKLRNQSETVEDCENLDFFGFGNIENLIKGSL